MMKKITIASIHFSVQQLSCCRIIASVQQQPEPIVELMSSSIIKIWHQKMSF